MESAYQWSFESGFLLYMIYHWVKTGSKTSIQLHTKFFRMYAFIFKVFCIAQHTHLKNILFLSAAIQF